MSLTAYPSTSAFADPTQPQLATNSVLSPPASEPTVGGNPVHGDPAPGYSTGPYGTGPVLGPAPGHYHGTPNFGPQNLGPQNLGLPPGSYNTGPVQPNNNGFGLSTGNAGGVGYSDPNALGAGVGCAPGSAAFQPFAGAGMGTGTGTGSYVGPSLWYAGAYGLVLTRDRQEHYTFSYDTGNEAIQYTDAKDADVGYGGGFAAVVGRYFNCGQNAVEAVYWGWFPDDSRTYTYGANAIGNLSGIFNWDSLTYNGSNMGTFVDNAAVHSLSRSNQANNVELNILSFTNGGNSPYGPSPIRFTWLAGVRNFRFKDQLTFSSDPNDTVFNGDVDEIHYAIDTTNNLTGFQLGGVGTYCANQKLTFNAGTKLGIYGNHISHTSRIYGTAGTATINNGPNAGREFYVSNTKDDVSFLSELFVGFGYCINCRWSASAGYRAIAVTGLALPTDQIYPDLRGINDVETIESPSSLILHGAYFGAQYCF